MSNLTKILGPDWNAEKVILFNEAGSPDFDRIDRDLSANIERRLNEWFPGKKITLSGGWFRVGNNGSLAVNAHDGHWTSHETSDRGQGLLSLYAHKKGVSLKEAAECLSEAPLAEPARKEPPLPKHQLGEPDHFYNYRDGNGRLQGAVLRWDKGDSKDIRQATLKAGRWQWEAMPEPRPLYGVERLRLRPKAPVLVVEGEKCVDALQSHAEDHIVLTWSGGSSAVDKSNWQPLDGRTISIWPDNDEPGRKAADAIKAHLPQAQVLQPPSDKPEKWDAADAIEEGFDVAAFMGQVDPSPFADIVALLEGDLKPEKPSLCELPDGSCLIYPGKINEAHGEPSVGKSNFALKCAAQLINEGKSVFLIDPEDTPQTALIRLLAFGAHPGALRERFIYSNELAPANWSKFHELESVSIVIVDGLAESLAVEGLNEDSAGDFLKWLNERLRPFARRGSAVLILDHVTKSTEARGRWSRGTGAKLGAYDGVSYSVELGAAYSPEAAGFVRLKVAKDRPGGRGKIGEEVAQLHFTPGESPRWATRQEIHHAADLEKRQRVIDAIRSLVSDSTEPTKSKIAKEAKMNKSASNEIIDELENEGFLKVESAGNGKASKVEIVEVDHD